MGSIPVKKSRVLVSSEGWTFFRRGSHREGAAGGQGGLLTPQGDGEVISGNQELMLVTLWAVTRAWDSPGWAKVSPRPLQAT